MTNRDTSDLVVLVPEAEPLIAEAHRTAHGKFLPAHVTVLTPWLSPTEMTDDVLERVASVIGQVGAFRCTFAGVDWFGDEVAYLRPDDAARNSFVTLVRGVWSAFPEFPPYEGRFGDEVNPHLTIGMAKHVGADGLRGAVARAQRRLPLSVDVCEVTLMAGHDSGGRALARHRFALGTAASLAPGAYRSPGPLS